MLPTSLRPKNRRQRARFGPRRRDGDRVHRPRPVGPPSSSSVASRTCARSAQARPSLQGWALEVDVSSFRPFAPGAGLARGHAIFDCGVDASPRSSKIAGRAESGDHGWSAFRRQGLQEQDSPRLLESFEPERTLVREGDRFHGGAELCVLAYGKAGRIAPGAGLEPATKRLTAARSTN